MVEQMSISGGSDISRLQQMYSSNKPIFMLIRKDGCPPCEETKPEWMKIPHSSEVNTRNIVIADVEEQALNLLDFMKPPVNIVGFPTMVHIKNKKIKSYEDSMSGKRDEMNGKSRTVDSFVNWIVEEHKTKSTPSKTRKMKGGYKRKSKRTRRRGKKSRR